MLSPKMTRVYAQPRYFSADTGERPADICWSHARRPSLSSDPGETHRAVAVWPTLCRRTHYRTRPSLVRESRAGHEHSTGSISRSAGSFSGDHTLSQWLSAEMRFGADLFVAALGLRRATSHHLVQIQITFVVAKLRLSFRGFSAPLVVDGMGCH